MAKKKSKINKPRKNTPHDALVKKIMENPVTAREFFDECLPIEFREKIDLSTVKVEKESFVEKSLLKQLSDVVLSVKTKNNKKAFIYILLEAQVTPDYWIALRLWKYMLLLCERHMEDKDGFPPICPLVFYHGTNKYDSPRNLWQLFGDPELARSLLTDDYPLVDLQSMHDDEINYDKHLSMILYMMKHISERDTLKLIEDIFKKCHKAILIDKAQDYVYTKLMIWYTDSKIPEERQAELEQIIKKGLSEKEGEKIMRTIAQKYIEEGEARGEARGKEKKAMEVAKSLLKARLSVDIITASTGLTVEQIEKIKLS
jgi:predicted transposase/invertase (TIGR01784 family)